MWAELVPHLDRTYLEWDGESLRALAKMVEDSASSASEVLQRPIQEVKTRKGDSFLDAERLAISEMLQRQRTALSAKLHIYVADRRRREILLGTGDGWRAVQKLLESPVNEL